MNDLDQKIDRLLRSAAQSRERAPDAMPFGFDTRVTALWRAQEEATAVGLTHLIRAVALTAVAVMAIVAAGTYREATATSDTPPPPSTAEWAMPAREERPWREARTQVERPARAVTRSTCAQLSEDDDGDIPF